MSRSTKLPDARRASAARVTPGPVIHITNSAHEAMRADHVVLTEMLRLHILPREVRDRRVVTKVLLPSCTALLVITTIGKTPDLNCTFIQLG